MVGSKSNHLIVDATVATQSAVLNLQRARDETGIFYINITGSALNINVKIQGRPDASASWFTITNFVEGDLSSGAAGGNAAAVVALFPQMRINASLVAGTDPVVNAWLIE